MNKSPVEERYEYFNKIVLKYPYKNRFIKKYIKKGIIDTNVIELLWERERLSTFDIIKRLVDKYDDVLINMRILGKGENVVYACVHYNKKISDFTSICVSPSLISMDGEFRYRMNTWQIFNHFYNNFSNMKYFSLIEDFIVKRIRNGDFKLSVQICIDNMNIGNEIKDKLNTCRLPIMTMVVSWILEYYNIYHNDIYNHTNPSYIKIINDSISKEFFKTLENEEVLKYKIEFTSTHTPENMYNGEFRNNKSVGMSKRNGGYDVYEYEHIPLDRQTPEPLVLYHTGFYGQKMIPMSYGELFAHTNIDYPAWRELYYINLCGELSSNGVCRNFSIANEYAFISNTSSDAYDNHMMKEKYKESLLGDIMIEELKHTDIGNYIDKIREFGFLNNKFAKNSTYIHKCIDYVSSAIRLTDISMLILVEFLGPTFRDFIRRFPIEHTYTEMMFQYMYALFCMHSHSKIVHGDLHTNNITLIKMKKHTEGRIQIVCIDEVVYGYDYYLDVGIIDFSRGLCFNNVHMTRKFGADYTEKFMREQINGVIKTVTNYFPTLITNEDTFRDLMMLDYAGMMKIISCIDVYAICRNITNLVHQLKTLCDPIMELAEKTFLTYMSKAFETRKVPKCEWMARVIIRDFFAHFIIDDDNLVTNHDILKKSISCVYNYNNPFDHIYGTDSFVYDTFRVNPIPNAPDRTEEIISKYRDNSDYKIGNDDDGYGEVLMI